MANYVNLLDIIYPVGSIYVTTNATSPSNIVGGTWSKITNGMLACAGTEKYASAGSTGGNDMLDTAAVPEHYHSVAAWNSASQSYISIGFWATNAAGGNLWNLLSYGNEDGGTSGYNLWTYSTTRQKKGSPIIYSQQPHIPQHYAVNVYKRTA
mgnify:CR=1 FL=1